MLIFGFNKTKGANKMKISTNKKELESLRACKSGYEIFCAAHGDKDALLSECLISNGVDDALWLMGEAADQFSDSQNRDIRLLMCDWAESVLHIFEEHYPDDNRPRLAIKAARDYANGLIDDDAMATAMDAARDAAWAAMDAARDAAWAAWAARDAAMAARYAARDAASAAARDCQQQDLKNLFLKWESEVNNGSN